MRDLQAQEDHAGLDRAGRYARPEPLARRQRHAAGGHPRGRLPGARGRRFERTSNPLADVASFAEDFLLADLEIVSGRVERLRESVKKPRPNRDAELAELAALEPLLKALEDGTPLADAQMNEEQLKVTRSFRLLTEKPKLVLFNVADDEADPERFVKQLAAQTPPVSALAVPAGLELELARMSPEDRAAFRQEMGIGHFDRDALLRTLLGASGQMLYFTHVGQAEVAAGVAVGELFVVEAQQVQDRGVQVVDVDLVFDGGEAEFVGGAVDVAALDAAAGQPHGEAVVVVVAAVEARQLGDRRAAELAAPDHQRAVEQAALLEVGEEGGDGLVPLAGQLAMVGLSRSS